MDGVLGVDVRSPDRPCTELTPPVSMSPGGHMEGFLLVALRARTGPWFSLGCWDHTVDDTAS